MVENDATFDGEAAQAYRQESESVIEKVDQTDPEWLANDWYAAEHGKLTAEITDYYSQLKTDRTNQQKILNEIVSLDQARNNLRPSQCPHISEKIRLILQDKEANQEQINWFKAALEKPDLSSRDRQHFERQIKSREAQLEILGLDIKREAALEARSV